MKKFILSTLFVFLMAFAFAAADDLSGSPIASESGNPGDSVTFDIVYTNTGSTAMTVSSTSTSLTSGTDTISAPSIGRVSVPANGSATVSFTMTVPAKTADTYIGTVTGTDTSNSANTESLPYSLVINSEDSFSVSTSSLTFDLQEDSESQTFTVTNDGSTTLSSWNFSNISITTGESKIPTGKRCASIICNSKCLAFTIFLQIKSQAACPYAKRIFTIDKKTIR